MKNVQRSPEIESLLFDHAAGAAVLDAVVQANLDLDTVTADEVRKLLIQFTAPVRRRAFNVRWRRGERLTDQSSLAPDCSYASPPT